MLTTVDRYYTDPRRKAGEWHFDPHLNSADSSLDTPPIKYLKTDETQQIAMFFLIVLPQAMQ